MFKKILLPLLAANTFTVLAGSIVLADPGFENSQSGWRTYAKNGTAQMTSEPGYPGGRFLKLTGNSGKCFISVKQLQSLPVSFRDEVRASVKMRGKSRTFIRLYWVGKDGKMLKKNHMQGFNPTGDWQRYTTIAQVPPQAAGVIMALEKISKPGETDCDDAELTIRRGAVLSNEKMLASVNINLAGVIDSAALAEESFQYTRGNRRGFGGGWFNVILPAKRTPGEFGNIPVKVQILEPGKKILTVQQVAAGEFAGLELRRTYELNECRISMTLELINHGKKPVETDLRVQNFAPADRGTFSWPTPDWLRIFHQTGEPLNGLNSVTNDLLRAGWQARSYEKNKTAVLFSYDIKRADKTLSFISPDIVTLEWYYRPVKLAPGEKFVTLCTAEILTGQTGCYADEIGKKQRAEAIVPKKLPDPPEDTGLPAKVRDTFMYAGGLGNLTQPEMGGMNSGYQYDVYKPFVMRVARKLTDAYFNTLGGVHLVQQGMHRKFYTGSSSRHEFGDFIRRHGLYFYLSRMMYHRRDVDPGQYRQRLPEILNTWKAPLVQKFVHDYQDRLLFVNTGDEPLAVNTDVVLAAHEELKKVMPPETPLISIVNSSSVELMPYMPVYFADIYPIKRQNSAGADPWRVYTDLADKVRRAGDKPVWFLMQAFCGGEYGKWSIYAYPTAGELRLMTNLAVAAGVRGISWYGVPGMSWPWVMNYFMNRMSVFGVSTMPQPGFEAVAGCGKELAGVGGLLVKCRPAEVPQSVLLQCGEYADAAGFYRGSEIRLFALRSPRGMVIMAVNQNPAAAASGTVVFPAPVWNFTNLTRCRSKRIDLQLAPGGAAYFYLGDDAGEIDLVFYSRYLREAARYRMAAERAKGNGIAVVDPDKFAALPGRKALAALMTEFAALEKAVAAAPLGKALEAMNEIRQQLGVLDFELCRDMELLVTPEMERATPKYRRWQKHPDAGVQAAKDAVLADFRDANKLTDQLDAGVSAEKLLPEIRQLQQRIKVDSARMRQILDKLRNGQKPDPLR